MDGRSEPDFISYLNAVMFHQATGVVMEQLGVAAGEARSCLCEQASALDRTVVDVARDLVTRHLRITASGLVPWADP